MSETKPQCESVIAERPPGDGREWDCQCARCGSSADFDDCWQCAGTGEAWEEYDVDDVDLVGDCEECHGRGGWYSCMSGADWCEANPQTGREDVKRGQIEWFTFERKDG